MVRRIMEEKICVICHRPFAWRKRWRRCWDEVLYCSAACRKQKRSARNPTDARS